jgi:D-lactate dehydrogenase (cytochrome)
VFPPAAADAPPIESQTDLLQSFLSDAAHVPGGFATGVAFPKSVDEVSALVRSARRVLPIGAQSSLTGGATPRGDLLISTRALTDITVLPGSIVRAGAGVPLTELRRALAGDGLYYPPIPTYDGAFVGGTIATNAAGAATFKYGSTRPWVEALSVVLADGSHVEITRGVVTASAEGWFEFEYPSGRVARVPVPTYTMPDVATAPPMPHRLGQIRRQMLRMQPVQCSQKLCGGKSLTHPVGQIGQYIGMPSQRRHGRK